MVMLVALSFFLGYGGGIGNGAGDCQQNLLTLGRTWTTGFPRGSIITPPANQAFL